MAGRTGLLEGRKGVLGVRSNKMKWNDGVVEWWRNVMFFRNIMYEFGLKTNFNIEKIFNKKQAVFRKTLIVKGNRPSPAKK